MRLIPVVRSRLRTLIAVTRDPDSILARACTGWLDAGTGAATGTSCSPGGTNEKTTDEADSELPAPTSSVICGLAMGDALALCLSKTRLGWEAEGRDRRKEFFKFHPGGQLVSNYYFFFIIFDLLTTLFFFFFSLFDRDYKWVEKREEHHQLCIQIKEDHSYIN